MAKQQDRAPAKGNSPSERADEGRETPGNVTVVGTPDPTNDNARDPQAVRDQETNPETNPGQSYPR